MKTRIIDLSITVESDPHPLMKVKITHLSHELGALDNQRIGGIDPKDWPFPGKSFADDFIEMTTHAGTHMDSPYHMSPVVEGKTAKTIDEWPLEWCVGDGVVLDIREFPDAYELTVKDVQKILGKMKYELKPGDIPLVMTGNDKYWGRPEYLTRGGHFGRDALKWVLDHGIKLVGTDSWTFGRQYAHWTEDYRKNNKDPKYLWPTHLLVIEKEYTHIEKLANLDLLPSYGFKFMAFPIKFHRGSAGFVRAVAFVEE